MASVENSPKAQRSLRKRERQQRQERRESLQYVMCDPRGRRFIYSQIFTDGCLTEVYLPSDSGIYRHEGRRHQAALLASEIQEKFPEEYVLMITERLHEQGAEKQARANAEEIAEKDEDAK